jgi:hypothetical protein
MVRDVIPYQRVGPQAGAQMPRYGGATYHAHTITASTNTPITVNIHCTASTL